MLPRTNDGRWARRIEGEIEKVEDRPSGLVAVSVQLGPRFCTHSLTDRVVEIDIAI